MTRYIKGLGLAMVAALAMSAVAASSASAEYSFGAGVETETLTGNQATQHVFSAGGTVTCNTAVFHGTVQDVAAEEQTITPTYSNCTAFGLTAHVKMNGCDYLFTTPDVTHEETSKFTGPAPHVQCETSAPIEITPTFFGSSVCTVKVPAQTPGGTVDYTNQGSGDTRDILVASTVEGIEFETIGGGGICGSTGQHSNGTYTGNSTLRGFADAAHTKHAPVFINH